MTLKKKIEQWFINKTYKSDLVDEYTKEIMLIIRNELAKTLLMKLDELLND
jgi:uncharacterized metal-binding protein